MRQRKRIFPKISCAAAIAIVLLFGIATVTGLASGTDISHQITTELRVDGESAIYYDDLTIEADDSYHDDVIVTSGDVKVKEGGRIYGALVVYNGDVTIHKGGIVDGDVIAFSGDATVRGRIGGSLVVWSGDIELKEGAVVSGDVSVMSGDIRRKQDAIIAGNILAGPELPQLPPILGELDLPNLPGLPEIQTETTTSIEVDSRNHVSSLLLRLVGATFFTTIVVLATGLVYYLRPALVNRIRTTLTAQKPTSFIIGLLLNIVLTMLVMVPLNTDSLFMTLCLIPIAFVTALLFLILNIGGWAALASIVGERLLSYTKLEPHALIALLVGATALTGTLSFVWALGGCVRPIAYFVLLILTALGSGSLIMNYLHQRTDGGLAVS